MALYDRITQCTFLTDRETRVRMNRLAAAIYMTAQGIPFIHAGEEFLREKIDEDGRRVENSYNAPDWVNGIHWNWLDEPDRRATSDYYAGLVAFRKAHAALRLITKDDVNNAICYRWITNELVLFDIKGKDTVPGEVSDNMIVIFNAKPCQMELDLYAHDVIPGDWQICIDGEKAGTKPLSVVKDGKVTLAPISAMVLVKGKTE